MKTISIRNDTLLASEIAAIGISESKESMVFVRFKSSETHAWEYLCKDRAATLKLLSKVKAQWLSALASDVIPVRVEIERAAS